VSTPLTDTRVDVDVDLDAEVACEVEDALVIRNMIISSKPCENPAEWSGFYPCCGRRVILCHPHHANAETRFMCSKCGQVFRVGDILGWQGL
jgi:hypothetical protein